MRGKVWGETRLVKREMIVRLLADVLWRKASPTWELTMGKDVSTPILSIPRLRIPATHALAVITESDYRYR